jgi:hypothetical protein
MDDRFYSIVDCNSTSACIPACLAKRDAFRYIDKRLLGMRLIILERTDVPSTIPFMVSGTFVTIVF